VTIGGAAPFCSEIAQSGTGIMKRILAGMVAVASVAGVAFGAHAQSFNCHRAYFADEKLICTSPELSRLDERLNRIFGRTRNLLSPSGRNALDREEERWVVARRRCGPDHQCVEDFYRDRIAELAERFGQARGDARRDDQGDNSGNDRDEPPFAARERRRDIPPPEQFAPEPPAASREQWRDVPPPERFTPEPPRMESHRERPVAASRARPDDSESRARPNDSERPSRREAAAPPPARRSSRDEASRGEEAPARRTPPPAASETRQPAPVQAGTTAQSGVSGAAAAPEPPSRHQAARRPANTTPRRKQRAAAACPRRGSSLPIRLLR
jgi:uncharacterized protein YecT (DUF1311 family)